MNLQKESEMALFTVGELAKMLRVNPQTLYRGVREGKIPHIKVCGSIRFDKAAIEDWLSRNSNQTVTMSAASVK